MKQIRFFYFASGASKVGVFVVLSCGPAAKQSTGLPLVAIIS